MHDEEVIGLWEYGWEYVLGDIAELEEEERARQALKAKHFSSRHLGRHQNRQADDDSLIVLTTAFTDESREDCTRPVHNYRRGPSYNVDEPIQSRESYESDPNSIVYHEAYTIERQRGHLSPKSSLRDDEDREAERESRPKLPDTNKKTQDRETPPLFQPFLVSSSDDEQSYGEENFWQDSFWGCTNPPTDNDDQVQPSSTWLPLDEEEHKDEQKRSPKTPSRKDWRDRKTDPPLFRAFLDDSSTTTDEISEGEDASGKDSLWGDNQEEKKSRRRQPESGVDDKLPPLSALPPPQVPAEEEFPKDSIGGKRKPHWGSFRKILCFAGKRTNHKYRGELVEDEQQVSVQFSQETISDLSEDDNAGDESYKTTDEFQGEDRNWSQHDHWERPTCDRTDYTPGFAECEL